MSKLANHIALFCSCDNTGYLVKYIDPVLGRIKINSVLSWTGSKLIQLILLSNDLSVWDVISNPSIRTGLDFKASPRAWSNCVNLKSSPVRIVGFEILLNAQVGLNAFSRCFSLTVMPQEWINMEYNRQNCRAPLFVSDPRYVPEYQFSSSSWTPAGIPSNGRASKKIPNAWCPESKDERSYLQVCQWLTWRDISNTTMRTRVDFKSTQFDQVRDEAENWIKMRGLEIYSSQNWSLWNQ